MSSNIDAELEREWAEAEKEWIKEKEEMDLYYDEIKIVNDAWIAKWPRYCRSCSGWGGSSYPATGPSYSCGGEPGGFDICDALPEGMCHRCRAMEYVERFEDAPCPACGWRCGDDGLRE